MEAPLTKEQSVRRVACYMTEFQHRVIKDAAEAAGLSMAAFIRQAAMKAAAQ
jgi:uncharacterized protein (DUF1778 family)